MIAGRIIEPVRLSSCSCRREDAWELSRTAETASVSERGESDAVSIIRVFYVNAEAPV
jgi:hypothetical protein